LSALKSHFQNLTPAEIQITNFIKEGLTSKEIADILNVAEKTVEIHRYNIRMKLGIKNKKINLRSHLLSVE
jgi:DNA-binding CsgD family transcriptional regulator